MTGGSLHTKYRPITLDGVVGQNHVVNSLALTLAEGKQQAFLLEGPSGTGKTTIARICAAMLDCSEIEEVDAASHTGVADMREIAARGNYRPFDGGNRAFIIDECHRLSKQAWESLLKDIEEPPQGVYWFFCTTEESKVPKTIKTRCIQYSLKSVGYGTILKLLTRVCELERLDVPEAVLEVAAMEADGSPRQGLVNLASVKHVTTEQDAKAALNRAAGSKQAVDLARALFKANDILAETRAILRELKDENPESVRITVFAYAQAAALGNDSSTWPLSVMTEFEKPCIDTNRIGDILLRCGRLHYKRVAAQKRA